MHSKKLNGKKYCRNLSHHVNKMTKQQKKILKNTNCDNCFFKTAHDLNCWLLQKQASQRCSSFNKI